RGDAEGERLLGRGTAPELQGRRQPGQRRDSLDAPDRWSGAGEDRPSDWRSTMSDGKNIRIFATGSCEGLSDILSALEAHEELERVGVRESIAESASALSGGHLDVVLHATRGSEFPAGDVAAIREYTRSPIIMLCSGESSGMLEDALEAGVADLLPLPQLT